MTDIKKIITVVEKPPAKKGGPQPGSGRPTKFSQELVDFICDRVAQGQPLTQILKKDVPNAGFEPVKYRSIMNWLESNDEFRAQYELARGQQADFLADEIVSIADSAFDSDVDTHAARLAVDARKWVASKMKPKKYGDRTTHVGDDDAPIAVKSLNVTFVDVPPSE